MNPRPNIGIRAKCSKGSRPAGWTQPDGPLPTASLEDGGEVRLGRGGGMHVEFTNQHVKHCR